MNGALARLAPHFFQVAWVVEDIAEAERWFQRFLGTSGFMRLDNLVLGENCHYRGRPSDSAVHISLGWLAGTQVELIQPLRGESLYSEALAKRGPGLHHVAFLVPDFDATLTALKAAGLPLAADGQIGGPGNRFAYFDCEAPGLSLIEILGFDAATRAAIEQMKQQAAAATAT